MAEMVIVFCVSPIVPEGLVLWTWNEQVIEKEEVAKAEAAEQAATEEKAAAAMKKEWFLTIKEVVLELSLSVGMCL